MDPNTGPVAPDPRPHPRDIAEPGPIDPTTGQPDRQAEVSAVKLWFRQNAVSLIITAVIVALVCIYLDPLDTLKVVIGLGLVIFIHELGHFLAAKWCDVHVKTFSIGFGPAVPFCSHKWGETTYMIGIIPLGGYVSMVGEGTGESVAEAETDEEENDPRSFKNKSVWNRMLIISAGVIMNVILGMACFAAAYLHGVREEPATDGANFSGGAAWRAGMRTGDHIVRIGSRENPTFKDLRPIVMSTRKDEKVPVVVMRDGKQVELEVEPLREEGTYFPTLGIAAQSRPVLYEPKKRQPKRWVVPDSPAAAAKGSDGAGFQAGDRIIAMSNPATYPEVTKLPVAPGQDEPDIDEFHRRMAQLAGKVVTIHVLRKGQPVTATPVSIVVEPAFRHTLGMRMRMGEIVALRHGGPAEQAGVVARSEDGTPVPGDRIKLVKLAEANGAQTWLAAGGEVKPAPPPNVTVKPLDPVLLPFELHQWALRNPEQRTVELVVLRTEGHVENTDKTLSLKYDDAYWLEREILPIASSPQSVSGLGLAYWVEAVVNDVVPGKPAAAAGLQANDLITAIRFKSAEPGATEGEWDEIKPQQWAAIDSAIQGRYSGTVQLRIKRGEEVKEFDLTPVVNTDWPTDDRGLLFQQDFRVHQAKDIGDAVSLGAHRTVRFIKEVYMNLYAMIFGRVSARTMSGPLTIATVSYKFAGEDFWQFLIFLGMISVNLAVVNFLPIPVLDGGHMVFLLIEKILGRPVPERLFAIAMYTGLFMILSLMVFVLFLDVRRLFFGLF